MITVGSFVHSDLVGKPKLPFIAPARRALVGKIVFSIFVEVKTRCSCLLKIKIGVGAIN